jgi:hypothetical protein
MKLKMQKTMASIRNRKSNLIPWISVAMWLISIAWFLSSGDPRIADGSLSTDEMTINEHILSFIFCLFGVLTVLTAAYRAYRAGSKFWFFGSIFLWPLAYVYCFLANKDNRAEKSVRPSSRPR